MFGILFEVLLIEIQEEILHFAGWEGGGLRRTKIVNKHFVNKLAFPNNNPELPRKFPKLPRKFPKLPRKFPDFPGGQPLSLGGLTPSPDSQKLSLTLETK